MIPASTNLDASAASASNAARRPLLVALLLVLLFYAAALPVMLLNLGDVSRGAYDQNLFHLVVVRQIAAQWPHPDFHDYPSSTTPGYHLIVAVLGRLTSQSLIAVRFIGSLFTAGLLFTIGYVVGRRVRWWEALILCQPLVCSVYVFSSGAFVLPDNAGWWGVLGFILIALRPKVDAWSYLLGGLVLLASVFVRQIHIWGAAPLLVAAFMGGTAADPQAKAWERRALRVMCMLLATLPAWLLLWWFRKLWNGHLVPPNQILTTGGNAAVPAIILGMSGIVVIFFAGYLVPALSLQRPAIRPWLSPKFLAVVGAIAGCAIAVIPHTSYEISAGRYSGIWKAATFLPTFADRSPIIIALAVLGGAGVALWLAALSPGRRAIWGTSIIAFTCAQSAAGNAWQRYYEPLILIGAALTASNFLAESDGVERAIRKAWAGPLILALLGTLITVRGMTPPPGGDATTNPTTNPVKNLPASEP